MKKIFLSFSLVLTFFLFLLFEPKISYAQCNYLDPIGGSITCGTTYCACCYQVGTTCRIDRCPAGYAPPNNLDFESQCQIGLSCNATAPYVSDCVPITPPPAGDCPTGTMCTNISNCSGSNRQTPPGGTCQLSGVGNGNCCVTTTTCPSDRPLCSVETGSFCTALGGTGISGYCIVNPTTVGQCCYNSAVSPPYPQPSCGTYPQPCCYPNSTNPNYWCDPGYNCYSIAGGTCCGTSADQCGGSAIPIGGGGIPAGPEVFCIGGNPNQRTNDPTSGAIATAIGCIDISSTRGFVTFLLRWGTGIAGGIAFILIIYSGFMIITSAGNPQKVQAGKELLTAAVTGLILLIFGVFVLDFIGVKILNIPGFGQ